MNIDLIAGRWSPLSLTMSIQTHTAGDQMERQADEGNQRKRLLLSETLDIL